MIKYRNFDGTRLQLIIGIPSLRSYFNRCFRCVREQEKQPIGWKGKFIKWKIGGCESYKFGGDEKAPNVKEKCKWSCEKTAEMKIEGDSGWYELPLFINVRIGKGQNLGAVVSLRAIKLSTPSWFFESILIAPLMTFRVIRKLCNNLFNI